MAAWEKCIDLDFKKYRLNSERSLQAAFWFRLSDEFNADRKRGRQIFIEPHIVAPNAGPLFPDLVICDSHQIIGVVELKYQPKKKPSHYKDLETLKVFWNSKGMDIGISNRRNLGPNSKVKNYFLSKDILMVWAGVHLKVPDDEKQKILPSDTLSQNHFLRLHAETSESEAVEISSFQNCES